MRTSSVAAIGVLLALSACGGRGQESEGGAPQTTAGGEMGQAGPGGGGSMSVACPMEVEGTTVQAENIEGGASLVFLTTGDVDDLRERVRHYAALREAQAMRMNAMESEGAARPGAAGEAAGAKTAEPMEGEPGSMSEPGDGADGAPAVPQVNTRVEDIEGGARLVLIPMDSADLEAVRMDVEQQAESMSGGRCPAMQQSMQPMP